MSTARSSCRPAGWSALVVAITSLMSAAPAGAGTVYFLVSEFRDSGGHNGDSFVLPLEQAEDVAHARDLVRRGAALAGRPLVFADIVAGGDGINRDLLAPGKPAWSWRVSRFDSFGDGGIELVDGWPGYIESDVQGWINNTGGGNVDSDGDGIPDGQATVGKVGFWGYTVTAELTGPANDLRPVPTAVPLPAGLPAGAALLGIAGAATAAAKRWR
ncbi:MAG TPA: hypothetical protein VER17_11085 [Tepidisphaeraceae bacterium]|nr:hypothetical protein [Tepidisphaeraceae bacterium]